MTRRLLFPIAALAALALVGCQAGTSAELLGYDNIQAAAVEARKGLVAYDQAIRLEAQRNHESYLNKVHNDVVKIALSHDETPENAQKLADEIVKGARAHFVGQTEQERRRAEWFAVTADNLDYILELCEDGKAFAIYRADVSAQWKAYLAAQARARLARMTDAQPRAAPAAAKSQ